MPRQIFKNLVIATAGPLPDPFTVENIQKWTRLRKGSFSEDLTDDVTHLLCTTRQFDKRVPFINKALALKKKSLHIIHYDWFDDSLFKDKRQKEKQYCMKTVLGNKRAAEREAKRLEKCKQEGERGVNTEFFRIYFDDEFFEYDIVITRHGGEQGAPGQRYNLCLWQSIANPPLYWFVAKFWEKAGGKPCYHRPSPCSGLFDQEMKHFKSFFRQKTRLEWQDRVLRQGTTSSSVFHYSPPTGGKPVGTGLRFSYDYCMEVNAQLRAAAAKEIKIKDEAWARLEGPEDAEENEQPSCCP